MNAQLEIDWSAQRNAILAAHEQAQPSFCERAREFVLAYLREHGPSAGEWLVDRAKLAGIVPDSSDKAFGAVFGGLSRDGLIVKHGYCARTKAHGTAGGLIWAISTK